MDSKNTIKVLLITNIFPNSKESNKGIFIIQEAVEITKLCELVVIAPVAWCPSILKPIFQKKIAGDVPKDETINGIRTFHPRWFVIPKFFRALYGFLFFFSILPNVIKIKENFDFDIIYAPWVYPDGFACVLLAKLFKKPVILHALGCDVNLYKKFFFRRQLIKWALKNSDYIISVSKALKESMVELGVKSENIRVIPNGVDTCLFRIMDKKKCRSELRLSLDEKIILFIGSLEEVKGVKCLIEAFHHLVVESNDKLRLLIIGKGYLRKEIEDKVEKFGLRAHVTLVGEILHKNIPLWMNAADMFCLPSIREGMPNVILEALACGLPIVATSVGGIPEIISGKELGVLVPPRDAKSLKNAFAETLAVTKKEETMIKSDCIISWRQNAEMVFEYIKMVLNKEMAN